MLQDFPAVHVIAYGVQMVEDKDVAAVQRRRGLEVLHLLGDLDWQLMDIDCLPFGIALPIHGAIQILREDPPAGVHAV